MKKAPLILTATFYWKRHYIKIDFCSFFANWHGIMDQVVAIKRGLA